MKKNLISAIAGWKSAALLALIAMVAAVAFSGVLSTTQTASAVLGLQVGGADNTGPYSPGTVVTVSTSTTVGLDTTTGGDYTNWTIQTTGGAEATFLASGTTTLTCQDATPAASACDSNTAAGTVTVAVKIADDSGAGAILVRATKFGGAATETDLAVLSVNPGLTPTSITLRAASSAISATDSNNNTTALTVTVKNSLGRGVVVPVDLVTTFGQFSSCEGTAVTSQACAATTTASDTNPPAATDGQPTSAPVLQSLGSPGTATVTATIRGTSMSATTDVTFYGAATGIEIASDQDALQIGDSTFIVVTITDAAGSPVARHTLLDTAVAVTGPAVPSVALAKAINVPKEVGPADGVVNGAIGELPFCQTGTAVYDTTNNVNYLNPTPPGGDLNGGTNAQGKCVIQVTASGHATPTNPADDATRGVHTVKVTLSATASASVEISVGGAPTTIESDAPARIDPSAEITVNVTVLDDEGDRVGEVSIEVDQTAGDGKIITDIAAMTASGRAKFTYLAPSTPGKAEFLVRTRNALGAVTASLPIIVTIGDAPEEAPEAPPATWNNDLVSGQNLVVWNGADGADPSEGAADGVSAIWSYNTGSGSWDGYFPDAADVPGGNTLTSLSNGQAYVVIVD